jgi:hypothetical protein
VVRTEVDTWTTDKLFEELLGQDAAGNKVTPPLFGKSPDSVMGGAVEQSRRWMVANMAEAAVYGRPMWGYEGGQHLTMGNADDADEHWLALLTAGNRDPRMARAYDRMLWNWRKAGGQTMALFNHIGVPSKYGAWGLKETQFTTEGVKWNAVLPWRDGVCWWTGCAD